MTYLVDTNVLLREANLDDPQYSLVKSVFAQLHQANEILHITPQVLIEFRSTATRSTTLNGLGLSPSVAEKETQKLKHTFPLLTETPAIFPVWENIVREYLVIGKQVHDARLVAVCQVYSISHVLTFNIGDFKRYDAIVKAVSPLDLASLH
jgi:predicted nucleic acid-binding protein